MCHLQLPDNWELTMGVFNHITRIATAEETREAEQECYEALRYYYDHFEQLNEEELNRLSSLIFWWGCKFMIPRVVVKRCPVYKNISPQFRQWFEELKTMYEQRTDD